MSSESKGRRDIGAYQHDKTIVWFNENLSNQNLWDALNRTYDFRQLPPQVRFLFESARRERGAFFFSRFGLFAAASTVKGAGNGLFALFRYESGDEVGGAYVGATMPEVEFEILWSGLSQRATLYEKERYLHSFTDKYGVRYVVDPTDLRGRLFPILYSDNVLVYANEPHEHQTANCYFWHYPKRYLESIVCVACSTLKPLDEIFVSYLYTRPNSYKPGKPCPSIGKEVKEEAPSTDLTEIAANAAYRSQVLGLLRQIAVLSNRNRMHPEEHKSDVDGAIFFKWTSLTVKRDPVSYEDVSTGQTVREWQYRVYAARELRVGVRIPLYGIPISATVGAARAQTYPDAKRFLFNNTQGYFDANPKIDPYEFVGGRGAFVSILVRRAPSSLRAHTNTEIDDTDLVVTRSIRSGDELLLGRSAAP